MLSRRRNVGDTRFRSILVSQLPSAPEAMKWAPKWRIHLHLLYFFIAEDSMAPTIQSVRNALGRLEAPIEKKVFPTRKGITAALLQIWTTPSILQIEADRYSTILVQRRCSALPSTGCQDAPAYVYESEYALIIASPHPRSPRRGQRARRPSCFSA